MRFIDLFAGLGGFHVSLSNLGHKCVFACELDPILRETYQKNFNIKPMGDIRQVNPRSVPDHEILCAGFPCQPFSKAGDQKGLKCTKNGTLIENVLDIINEKKPKYILLENVPNLEKHDNGETWAYIRTQLENKLGKKYEVDYRILSPHLFGIPQIRRRMFIVGAESLEHLNWPEPDKKVTNSIHMFLDKNPKNAKPITKQSEEILTVWQEFLESYPDNERLPWFPIWSMEFGATYPYEDTTPHMLSDEELKDYKGNHGIELSKVPDNEIRNNLPSYALRKVKHFPDWKINFIQKNRELYEKNVDWLDDWIPKIKKFAPSHQKFEWNCKGEKRNIWDYIIQFRASGVRVKRPTTSPSLVAMTTTQIPIIAWEKRYLTVKECSRLQGFDLKHLPETITRAMKALGNAVNVSITQRIAESLIIEKSRIPQVIKMREKLYNWLRNAESYHVRKLLS